MATAAGVGPAGVLMGTECVCHVHREMVPVELHHVWPLGMGGPNVPANKILVCANAHYSIHSVLDMLVKADGKPPPADLRLYGPKVRRYARSGYNQWKAHNE